MIATETVGAALTRLGTGVGVGSSSTTRVPDLVEQ